MTRAPAALAPIYLKLLLIAMVWGGQYPAARYLAPWLPPYTAGALRYIVAVAVLSLIFSREGTGWPRPARRDWPMVLALGATGVFLFNAFFFAAFEHITASRAVLLTAGMPALTAVGARMVFGSRLDITRWLGIVIAVFGVAVVVSDGDLAGLVSDGVGIGDLLIFGSMLCWVGYTMMTQAAMSRLRPLHAFSFAAMPGMVMLVIAAILESPWQQLRDMPAGPWIAVLYLGALGTVLANIWYLHGVQRIGPTRTQIFMNLVPVFGVLVGWVLLDEPLLPSLLVGGVLVLAGVALTNRPSRPGT